VCVILSTGSCLPFACLAGCAWPADAVHIALTSCFALLFRRTGLARTTLCIFTKSAFYGQLKPALISTRISCGTRNTYPIRYAVTPTMSEFGTLAGFTRVTLSVGTYLCPCESLASLVSPSSPVGLSDPFVFDTCMADKLFSVLTAGTIFALSIGLRSATNRSKLTVRTFGAWCTYGVR